MKKRTYKENIVEIFRLKKNNACEFKNLFRKTLL